MIAKEPKVENANLEEASRGPSTIRALDQSVLGVARPDPKNFIAHLNDLYVEPFLRANRISRMEESFLGDFALNPDTALYLGKENIGVLVAECGSALQLQYWLRQLDCSRTGGYWIVLSYSKELARELFRLLGPSSECSELPRVWTSQKVIFTTPEGLHLLLKSPPVSLTQIAALLVLDFPCCMHRARGMSWEGEFAGNDRPQKVVDFRASLNLGGWSAPILIFTQKPSKSIPTEALLSPYCLEGFWFMRGSTVRCDIE